MILEEGWKGIIFVIDKFDERNCLESSSIKEWRQRYPPRD